MYVFKDVTDVALKEINLVPGYDLRKTDPKGMGDDRIFRIWSMLLKNIDETAPDLVPLRDSLLAKKEKKQDFSAEFRSLINEAKKRNLPWLTHWGCQKMEKYYYAKAEPTNKRGVEKIVIHKKDITPQTRDFVIEAEGNHKPKLYAVSVPENYFLPEKKLNRLFLSVFFRPAPWQAADHEYQIEAALKPVDTSLRTKIPGRDFYPYGWDYLFFNLWSYLYTLTNLPNDDFLMGLAYQAYLSEKDVITVVPMMDINLKGEEIIEAKSFGQIMDGIAQFVTQKIQETNPSFKTKEFVYGAEELFNDTNAASPYRVAVSANSNGCIYALSLFQTGLNKLNFVKEVYLFDPSQLENVHNNWVNAALAWAGRNSDRYVRVYTQPFAAFTDRNKVINHKKVETPNTIEFHQGLDLQQVRSLAEFNLSLLQTQPDFDKSFISSFKNTKPGDINEWRAKHSMIPGLMYTDALRRSGFKHFTDSAAAVNSRNLLASPNQSKRTGIRKMYWTDEQGIDLSGERYKNFFPYGGKIKLHIQPDAMGIDLLMKIFINGYAIYQQKFISTLNPYIITLDTKTDANIFGDSEIKAYVGPAKANMEDLEEASVKIDIVPYIPVIMAAKGWTVAVQCLNQWFSNTYDPAKTKYDLSFKNILKMDWALGFPYVRSRIESLMRSPKMVSAEAKEEIIRNIKLYISSGKLTLPANINDSVDFGIKDNSLNPNGRNPIDYYFFGDSLRGSMQLMIPQLPVIIDVPVPTSLNDFDDFIAAVNECMLVFIALGKIKKISNTLYEVSVEKAGVYIWEWFDFEDNFITKLFDADLGYWNVKTNDVGKLSISQPSHSTAVSNKMFRDWRTRNLKGQDYTNLSDIKEFPFNLQFRMNNDFKPV